MRRYLWCVGLVGLFAGCERDAECGSLMFDRNERRCVCPDDAPYDPELGGCVLSDGGVIPYTDDAGTRDGSVPDGCAASAETCNGRDDDCDGDVDEAAATAACEAVPGATRRACTAGECVVIECASGFDDCDDEFANGCEAELAVDEAHCGSCGRECAAGQVCEASTCEELPRIDWITAVPAPGVESSVADVDLADDGSICVLGSFSGTFVHRGRTYQDGGRGDIFVAELNRAGALEWVNTLGTARTDVPGEVAAVARGGCLVVGALGPGTARFGAETRELSVGTDYVARFTSSLTPALLLAEGNVYFADVEGYGERVFAAVRSDAPSSLGTTSLPAGDHLVALDGLTLEVAFARATPVYVLHVDASGVFVGGMIERTTTVEGRQFAPGPMQEGRGDVLLTQWSHDGALSGGVVMGRASYDHPLDIVVDGNEVVRVLGESYVGETSSMEVIWSIPAGSDSATIETISPTPSMLGATSIVAIDGEVVASGSFGGGPVDIASDRIEPTGQDGVFVAGFDEAARPRWARAYGSPGSDFAIIDADHRGIVMAGYASMPSISFPETTFTVSTPKAGFVLGARVR